MMNIPKDVNDAKGSFLAQLNAAESAIHHRFVELEQKAAELKRMKMEFEQNFSSGANERLTINCGGCEINVQRGVLTQFRRSGLAALFCGKYDHLVDRDAKGRMFLDLDPNAFYSLVEYLTAVKEGRAKVGRTSMMAPEDQHANIDALIDHFKLRPYLTGVVKDDEVAQMRRRDTVMGASAKPSLDEIRERSDTLRPLIGAFEDLIQSLFHEEKKVVKHETGNSDWETIFDFEKYAQELYASKEDDPIDYVNSLDVQFMCKRSTMKLSEFLYNLQRNRRGEVILTNPGSIVGKILEYLRRRKIRLDDRHVGDLWVEESEWDFFNATVRSFGVLEDLKVRAQIKKFNKQNSKPQPMALALPSSDMVGQMVGEKRAKELLNQQAPARPAPPAGQPGQPQFPGNAGGFTGQQQNYGQQPQQQQQPMGGQQQMGGAGQQRPEGWSAQQWSQYQQQNQQNMGQYYQQQQQQQYAGMSPEQAWAAYYAAQGKGGAAPGGKKK